MKRALILFAGLATSIAVAGSAAAYVRYKTASGTMFKWPQTCVALTAYPDDLLEMMSAEEIIGAVDAAAATWSTAADPCTYLNITVASATGTAPRATNDGRNNVIFRTKSWCKLTAAGECDSDPATHYDVAALALTSVSAGSTSGIIRDADIEVNAIPNRFKWADLVAHPELRGNGQSFHDLQNAVTHEMGHLIGFDHTCYLQPPAPIDNNGFAIPDCANASPEVLATTMYPSANPGDIDKRTLAPDDQQAVCDVYPADQDPKTCSPTLPESHGCSCATGGAAAPAAGSSLVAVAALVAARARRRRRRS